MTAPSPESVDRDLVFSVLAAREAGRRLLTVRNAERWEGKTLGDVGDQAADGYLQGMLLGRYPEDGVLSEETADSADRLGKRRTWIVDPLDGTKEYAQGRDDWGVHVALTIDGRCALGAVALPSLDKVLWGVCLDGQERAGIEGEGELVHGDSEGPTEGPRVVVSRSHTPPWVERFSELVGASSHEGWGSAGFKTSHILLGHADVYVHKIGLKEWDTCAPETIARSLGWSVFKLRGEEHAYNQENPRNHELVICRPALRERVIEAIAGSGALEDG